MKLTTITLATMMCMGFAVSSNAQQANAKPGVDAEKVNAVNDWAKRKGATEIWVSSPQESRTHSATTGKESVDSGKVATVNDWAKRKGATEVWVNNPQEPRKQGQARNGRLSPAATTGAEPVTQTARMGKPATAKHARKSKRKNILPHSPPVQSPESAQ